MERTGKIVGSAPILLVADVVASAEYFRDRLGFEELRFWGEPPNFSIVRRDGFAVMLSQVAEPSDIVPHYKIVSNMWNAYFWVDDAAALYDELVARGATIDYELCEQPYGVREFGVQDLDDHDIAFGQDLDASSG